jgi:hypothetical protein
MSDNLDVSAELARLREENAQLLGNQVDAENVKALLLESVKRRVETLPDDWRNAIPAYEDPAQVLKWLDDTEKLRPNRKAPHMDAGRTHGTSAPQPNLSAQELETARGMGMTPEAYANRKNEIAAQRRNW